MSNVDRRNFIKQAGIFAAAVTVFGCASFKPEEERFVGDCKTTDDILGPFYRPNAPIRKDLTYEGQEGTQVIVHGKVYGEDCTTPLKNALVELWHADHEGDYDNQSKAFLQRARWYTKENGTYSFKTIVPGRYLNGGQYRPAHFHFRVTNNNNKELISQVYFKGDPYIEVDPWASEEKAKLRILPMEEVGGAQKVHFNIYLANS